MQCNSPVQPRNEREQLTLTLRPLPSPNSYPVKSPLVSGAQAVSNGSHTPQLGAASAWQPQTKPQAERYTCSRVTVSARIIALYISNHSGSGDTRRRQTRRDIGGSNVSSLTKSRGQARRNRARLVYIVHKTILDLSRSFLRVFLSETTVYIEI